MSDELFSFFFLLSPCLSSEVLYLFLITLLIFFYEAGTIDGHKT